MAVRPEQRPQIQSAEKARSFLLWVRKLPGITLALLFLVWVVPALVPAETGLRFGLGFQIFFTVIVALGMVFFWFLRQEQIPHPKGSLGVLASVAGVYLATVGLLVAVALVAPQFGLPRPQEETKGQAATERGRTLFMRDDVGCFRCHIVAGSGGTRGPDLTQVATRAGDRVSSLSAERYLLEKVKAGATYQYTVPDYVPIMPAFGRTLSEEEMADLVAYLLSLK